MSDIVLGIGTSHSPLLSIDARLWVERAKDDLKREKIHLSDGRVISYAALAAETHERYADEATAENFILQANAAQAALDRLEQELLDAKPDLLVIVGDDQEELFTRAHMPAIAIYTGAVAITHPKNEVSPNLPEWYREANVGYGMDTAHHYQAAPAFAMHLVESLISQGVDLAIATEVRDAKVAGFGHAYGFVVERLLRKQRIPIVPVMLNTYYPPNVPTPARCYDVGRMLAAAIEAHPEKLRVAVLASGGLSHFHTDEPLDRLVLDAFDKKDSKALRDIPVHALRSGTSEILNWIMTAGALEKLNVAYSEYIPVRRTPAGTGIGLGFVAWRP